jgi:hypothetical protein
MLLAIHCGRLWREHQIDASRGQQLNVGGECSRVTPKIFARAKLRWIDENGHYHQIALLAASIDERQVPLMQGAHRRHHANRFTSSARIANVFSQLGGIGDHSWFWLCWSTHFRRRFYRIAASAAVISYN